MEHFTHCLACHRKLLNVFFCPHCRECLCSIRCLKVHLSEHDGTADGADVTPQGAVPEASAVPSA